MDQEFPSVSALSLWQPWASLMFTGAKGIETRHWPTSPGKFIAIHAAKKWDGQLQELANSIRFQKYLAGQEIPLGVFGAIGYLDACLSTNDFEPSMEMDEYWFGDYSPDRFAWRFSKFWKLPNPVPAIGRQGLWKLDPQEAFGWLTPEQKTNLLEYWRRMQAEKKR